MVDLGLDLDLTHTDKWENPGVSKFTQYQGGNVTIKPLSSAAMSKENKACQIFQ